MDTGLNQEQRLVKEMVHKFALNELEPRAQEADASQQYPREILGKMSELGLLGMTLPASYGGSEMDSLSLCIVTEEISKACASTGSVLIAHTALCAHPLCRFGTDFQKETYLPKLAAGELLGTFASNDIDDDSDPQRTVTTATEEDESYLVSGLKTFVINGENADLYVLFAEVNGEERCFLVERRASVQVSRLPYLMGMRASGISEIRFDACQIPKTSVLNGKSREIEAEILDLWHLLAAAQAVGIAQASLESSVRYSRERRQFGRPICEFQQVKEMLSEIVVRTAAARALVQTAALQRDSQNDYSQAANMAKLFAAANASRSARTAVQIYGGYGYTTDFPVERYMRDAKVTELYGSTPEEEKIAIASRLLD